MTTSSLLAIPDSLAFYWGDRANRAAVDILCQGGLTRPAGPDLSIEEYEAFETARLAALRVRHDLWRLLRTVWSGTWGAAMATRLPQARLLDVGGHDLGNHGSYAPTVERGWDERLTCGLYALRPGVIAFTKVRLEQDDRRFVFLFSLMDTATGDYPAGFEMPSDWREDGEGWFVAEVQVECSSYGEIDMRLATQAATTLITQIAVDLEDGSTTNP